MAIPKKAASLSEFFNTLAAPLANAPTPQAGFSLRTATLPNGQGSYQSPVPNMSMANGPQAPGKNNFLPTPAPTAAPAAPVASAPSAPMFGGGAPAPAPSAPTQSSIPPQWIKPGGGLYTPDEVAANIAKAAPTNPGGDIGRFAAQQFGNKDITTEEAMRQATLLNNARNDIATGENDMMKVASESGIAYTAAELGAIEKAYSGIYDPALTTALAKLESKQEEDRLKREAEAKGSEGFTLGKDQVRYDADGNIIAVGVGDGDTTVGVYTAGSNPTVDSYIKGIRSGTYKPSDVPDEYKALVAQGMAATRPTISEASNEAVSVIDSLLSKGGALGSISGVPSIGGLFNIPGTDATDSRNLAKQLKGILSLENRDKLKGSGAISDFEFKVLGEASSALGIGDSGKSNLSDADFIRQLQKLKLKLEVGETSLPDDELLFLQSKGYTPEQIREYGDAQSFSSVGNTKVSTSSPTGKGNLPQRNNNPGNVKKGGLADSLAIGTDSQGHLKFKNSIDGFKALTMDLTAKVNGGSRHLPANPTIAQLGKVYAEDPAWANSVAKILGVSPSTPTGKIPITNLAQAIARQEGFYA